MQLRSVVETEKAGRSRVVVTVTLMPLEHDMPVQVSSLTVTSGNEEETVTLPQSIELDAASSASVSVAMNVHYRSSLANLPRSGTIEWHVQSLKPRTSSGFPRKRKRSTTAETHSPLQ